MGYQLIKQPNGRFAVFTTVSDKFLLANATAEEVVVWRMDEASLRAKEDAERWIKGEPPYQHGDLKEALRQLRRVHGVEAADEMLELMTSPVDPNDDVNLAGESIEMKRTGRGFVLGCFTDRYGAKCSIQKSSLATEDAIWLGVDDANPRMLVQGQGWQPIDMQKHFGNADIQFTTRMHLTRGMARQLLPLLRHFVETGELPQPEDPQPK